MSRFPEPRASVAESPAVSEKGPSGGEAGGPPKMRLSTTGLRRLLLPRSADPLSGGAPRRLAEALFGLRSEGDALAKRGSVLEFLSQVSLFEGLGRIELQRVARIVHERDYGDGEYISREGRPGAALFILRRGLVEVTRRGPDGTDVTLATLEPPASFEEDAATGTDTIRRFSTRARGPVSLLALGKPDLDALCDGFPLLANKVLMRLAGIVSSRFQKLLDALDVTESLEADENAGAKG